MWKVVEKVVEYGVIFVLINVFIVMCMGEINVLVEKINLKIILVDVISIDDFIKFFMEF